MLPPATKQRFAAAVSVGLLRLIALSFTLTLMLAAAVAVMDVTVWQCTGLDYCGSTLGPLSFMVSAPRGVQVALSAVPLVVVIATRWPRVPTVCIPRSAATRGSGRVRSTVTR
jgi:hypothetical protein